MNIEPSPNFAFLAHHDPRLVALATQAEEHFERDPSVCLYKLRLFGEVLAKRAAAKVGLPPLPVETQQQLVDRLADRGAIAATPRALFHDLRRVGNVAIHEGTTVHSEALHQLRMARELAIWFQRSFGNNRKFDPGPFVPPPEPKKADTALRDELDRLRREMDAREKDLVAAQQAIAETKKIADAELAQRLSAEERAAKAREESAIWEELATQKSDDDHRSKSLEEQNKALLAELWALQAVAQAMGEKQLDRVVKHAAEASDAMDIDEAATRRLIDHQLRDAGWEVDSRRLTFERGARPARGRNMAISEWPTMLDGHEGWADYILFAGLQVVAVVEAKRKRKDIDGVIPQAKRYSRGYQIQGNEAPPPGGPWCKDASKNEAGFKVPFLFATNGRPYLRQFKAISGVWFLDARRPQNHPVALDGWYTPEGLVDLLKQNVDEAHARLKAEPMLYIDREYQQKAILAAEKAIEEGKRELLVAMATGTGKTRTCIDLCYRLLKTRRFRRVLFLVDRNALGKQTADVLKEFRLEGQQTFADIFDVRVIGDIRPESDTRLHIATVQAMVKRVLGPHTDESERSIPPVDQYDCIVVDECHRGYLLDRELSDRELLFRDEEDYISKYRRVLDHFDATKIGLTATPALHTTEIFGAPVFSYSYREAVVDGFLVDHEPPIRIVTKLGSDGIHYQAHEEVLVLDRRTKTVAKEALPDELDFKVDAFNRRVITEPFNRAVLGELANYIDPEQEEKTLVFAVTDEHANMVVKLLKEIFAAKYGEVDDEAVQKITGETDRPLETIRRYRNERLPSVAVTVDLLTTGIDVPRIANLVFLRQVRSRILYEQMIGRATRLCNEIGKERFRIFDAVNLYSKIQDVTDMKPVVVNPLVTFEQLVKEIASEAEEELRQESLRELIAKLQRKKRGLKGDALERFETAAGMPVEGALALLKSEGIGAVAEWLGKHESLAPLLDRETGGGGYKIIVSEIADEVREVTRGYGKHQSRPPGDYLDGFRAFLESQMNQLPALLVITQRPRDLTRADLKALLLHLDEAGYTELLVRSAWRETKNEDIAATLIGYIRRLALGSPLVPYAERVDKAVQRLKKAHAFTDPQRQWLDRIAAQLKAETIVDRAALDAGQFKSHGGFARLDKVFGGKLEAVLGELTDEVWKDAG